MYLPRASAVEQSRSVSGGRGLRCVFAAGSKGGTPQQPQKPKQRVKLPERGFFAEADTKAEVYAPLGGVGRGNIYERKGRYNPEFLWNTNWQEQLELEESVERAKASAPEQQQSAVRGLGLSAVAELDSMDVDLTGRLLRRSVPTAGDVAEPLLREGGEGSARAPWQGRQAQMQRAAAARGPAAGAYPRMPPRRGEAARWERSKKFAKRAAPAEPITAEEEAQQAAAVQAERAAYARYKRQLLASTAGLGAALSCATFAFYSRDVAASYTVGAVSSVVYLNMLNRSIDGVGGDGGGSGGAMAAQPRLLIPLIMAMGYNRWNTMAAGTIGVELQLMPMLLGFLTYKGSVIARGAADLFADLIAPAAPAGPVRQSQTEADQECGPGPFEGGAGTLGEAAADDVIISRDYASRVLQG